MKHLLLSSLLLLCLALPTRAQFGRFIWQTNIGTADKRDFGRQLIRLRRGGYMMCGSHDTLSLIPAIYLAKVSEHGVLQWQRAYTFNGFFGVDGIELVENRSGQVLVSGYGYDSTGNQTSNDAVLMLIDSTGQKIWSKEYHSPLTDYISSLHLFGDNNFSLLATTLGRQDVWRIDSTGTILQASASPGLYTILPLNIGGYAAATSSVTPFPGYSQLVFYNEHMVETGRGDTLPYPTPYTLLRDSQGNYLTNISGRLAKLSPQGDSLWNKLYGNPSSYISIQSVAETGDNSYVAVGERYVGSQSDLVLLELARDGSILRDTTLYRFAGSDHACSIVLDPQGNYVVLGWTDTGVIGGAGTPDVFMFKMRPFRTLSVVESVTPRHITLYPNPTTDVIRLRSQTPISGTVYVRDLLGRVVRQQCCSSATLEVLLSMNDLTAGVYILTLATADNRLPRSWRVVKQ